MRYLRDIAFLATVLYTAARVLLQGLQ